MLFLWTLLLAEITMAARKWTRIKEKLDYEAIIGEKASILCNSIVISTLIGNSTLINAPLYLLCVDKFNLQFFMSCGVLGVFICCEGQTLEARGRCVFAGKQEQPELLNNCCSLSLNESFSLLRSLRLSLLQQKWDLRDPWLITATERLGSSSPDCVLRGGGAAEGPSGKI